MMKLKVSTFNLRYDNEADKLNRWIYRVDSVIKFLEKYHPHIIGMQEVLDNMRQDIISRVKGYDIIGMTRTEKGEATPILYDKEILDIRESGTFWLSKTPNIPDTKDFNSYCVRICTWAEFVFRNNRKFRFRVFNTHLDHKSKEAQIEGIKIIYDKIKIKNNDEYLPTFVTGDFNVGPSAEPIEYIKSDEVKSFNLPYIDCYSFLTDKVNERRTFHKFTGSKDGEPIDYIFASPNIIIEQSIICRDKFNGRYLSDHYPVIAFTEINN